MDYKAEEKILTSGKRIFLVRRNGFGGVFDSEVWEWLAANNLQMMSLEEAKKHKGELLNSTQEEDRFTVTSWKSRHEFHYLQYGGDLGERSLEVEDRGSIYWGFCSNVVYLAVESQ